MSTFETPRNESMSTGTRVPRRARVGPDGAYVRRAEPVSPGRPLL